MEATCESKSFAIYEASGPTCCLRIFPLDCSFVLVGLYKLENDGTRNGAIEILRFDGSNFQPIRKLATTGAVLDIKFGIYDQNLVATSHSTGNILFWRFDAESSELTCIKDVKAVNDESLITSVFFSPLNQDIVLATSTSGEVFIISISTAKVEIMDSKHDLECWTGNFGELGELSNVIFSGGDDAKLLAHDLRTKSKIWETGSRHHQAGVVSILPPGRAWNHMNPGHLWTGSYDDHMRVLDLRLIDKSNPSLISGIPPKVLSEHDMGGGVWRLVPSPIECDDRVMSCCMYDGARIIRPKENDYEVEKYFKGSHQSICYGGDWSSDGSMIITCSFYDKIVQAWSPDLLCNT